MQEVVALANLALVKSAIILSNSATLGPWTTQPDSSTEVTAPISSLSKYGFVIGIFTISAPSCPDVWLKRYSAGKFLNYFCYLSYLFLTQLRVYR